MKSSVVGRDKDHVTVISGRSLVLDLQGGDLVDVEISNVMAGGRGFYNATFCVTLIRATNDALDK